MGALGECRCWDMLRLALGPVFRMYGGTFGTAGPYGVLRLLTTNTVYALCSLIHDAACFRVGVVAVHAFSVDLLEYDGRELSRYEYTDPFGVTNRTTSTNPLARSRGSC